MGPSASRSETESEQPHSLPLGVIMYVSCGVRELSSIWGARGPQFHFLGSLSSSAVSSQCEMEETLGSTRPPPEPTQGQGRLTRLLGLCWGAPPGFRTSSRPIHLISVMNGNPSLACPASPRSWGKAGRKETGKPQNLFQGRGQAKTQAKDTHALFFLPLILSKRDTGVQK